MLPDEKDESGKEMCKMSCSGKSVEIDEIDYKLLNELAVNARAPLIELAAKLNYSSQSVNYRIKNLVKSGVITAFRVDVDLSKLDLHSYKVDIYLKDHKLKKSVVDFLKDKSYLEYINFAIGWSDLEPEFVVKDFDELLFILDEINTKFSGVIKKQSFFITEALHKLRCMPKLE